MFITKKKLRKIIEDEVNYATNILFTTDHLPIYDQVSTTTAIKMILEYLGLQIDGISLKKKGRGSGKRI